MAGPSPLRFDPAIDRLAAMTKSRWRYFRWTPRSALIGFIYVGVIPATLAYYFAKTDGKYNMRGKLRGDIVSEW